MAQQRDLHNVENLPIHQKWDVVYAQAAEHIRWQEERSRSEHVNKAMQDRPFHLQRAPPNGTPASSWMERST